MSSFIEIKDLHFSYVNEMEEPPVKTEVLKGINLDIQKGEFVAVLGHNGSGKSTLAKCINAINIPESGSVLVNGLDTKDEKNLLDIRKTVGMVFQNPDNQIVATIVEEDVAFALENMGVDPKEIRQRVDDALKTVGMYEYREHAPHKLSGGQKQRVAIAGVIAMRPQCILLDEPTAMLDPKGRAEVMSIIKNLADMGTTIILCTHILSDVERTANRIGIVRDGRMAVEGTISEIKEQYDKAGKKIVMGIFGDPSAAIQPVSTLTGGNFYFDRQRAVFEIPIASDINEQETAHRLFDLLNSAGLTVSLFVIENKTLEQIYMETIG